HEAWFDASDASGESAVQRAVADQIDQTRRAARSGVDGVDRRVRELNLAVTVAGNAQTTGDVSRHAIASEGRQLASYGDPLIDLTHLRKLQVRAQLRLTDEHDLQQLLAALEVGQDANFFEE